MTPPSAATVLIGSPDHTRHSLKPLGQTARAQHQSEYWGRTVNGHVTLAAARANPSSARV